MSSFLSNEKKKEIADNTYSILSGSKSSHKINFNSGKHKNVHIPEISIITHEQSINLPDPILNNFFDFLNNQPNLYTINATTSTIEINTDNFKILQYNTDESSKFGYVLYLTEASYNQFTSDTKFDRLRNDMSNITLSDPDTKSIESITYSVLGEVFNPVISLGDPSQKSINKSFTDSLPYKIEIKNI